MNIDRHGDISTFARVAEKEKFNNPSNKYREDLKDDILEVITGSYETRMTSVEQKRDQI